MPELFSRLVKDRQSVRAFLPQQVPERLLQTLVMSARCAPSGSNLQPGTFLALQGAARERLSSQLIAARRSAQPEAPDYSYFTQPLPLALKRRQVATAQALYGAVGIAREDRAARDAQFERNYRFFDAPVALVITIARDAGSGSYLDLGMAVYGLMLAAQSHGLASCAIGALASYPDVVRHSLQLDARCAVVCGLAVGYADPAAPVNQATTARCELKDYFRVIA